jgi:ABC-type branched-subunit amino acid transport system ATPase component/ABC-type branched-subunit amino acid transport system permease subunit
VTEAQGRRATAAVALLLAVALPLSTSHWMPDLIQGHTWLTLDVAVAIGLAALSLNLLLGYAGQISLGHAGLLGAGAFMSGTITSRWDLPMPLGILVAGVSAAVVALVIGIPALRLKGLYLAIATAVFGLTMQYSVFRSSLISGGSGGIALPRRNFGGGFLTDNAQFLVVCLVVLIAIWAVDVNITKTRVGRAFRVIREDEAVAQSFGIEVIRYKLLAFVVAGAIAGVAGALYGHAIGFVNNDTFNLNLSLEIVIMVIVGGAGYRLAVMLAAVAFVLLPNYIGGLRGWEYVIGAVVLMVAVSRHPGGIAELLTRRRICAADDDEPTFPTFPAPVLRGVAVLATHGAPLLEVRGLTVRFGGLTAVDNIDLDVPSGAIVGLIGPNGAGKTTLFNAVSGLVATDGGHIRFQGREIQGLSVDARARRGIARSFQQVGLAKDLSLRENFLVAQHQLARYTDIEALLMLRRAARTEATLRQRADDSLAHLDLARLADMPVRTLSGGQQRLVEIACLLMTAPELVLLDEPSAGLSPAATKQLSQRVKELRDMHGRTVLLIEHNIPMVLETCDYVYVLDAGRVIADGEPAAVVRNSAVIDAYFGRAVPA